MTIEVDGLSQSPSSPKSGRDAQEWHLSSGNQREPDRRWKVHTIDVYLWALDDAKLVIECFKRLLPANQLDVPEEEHEEAIEATNAAPQLKAASAMSPVVQNLENMAVHDPEYNGQHRNEKAVSPSPPLASQAAPSLPPMAGVNQPMSSPSPAISDLSSGHGQHTSPSRSQAQSTNFTPMAYNPAAPQAPEPIAHREKTPPPDDHEGGTGLSHAARHDQVYTPGQVSQSAGPGGYQVGHGAPVTFGGGYASPPPQFPGAPAYSSGLQQHSSYATSPPPAAGYSYGGQQDQRSSAGSGVPSFGPGASSTPQQGPRSSTTSNVPSFGPGAPSTLKTQPPSHNHSSAAEVYSPIHAHDPIPTPGTQFYSSLPPANKPLTHIQPQYADYLSAGGSSVPATSSSNTPQPPMGGYSQYNYGQPAQQAQQSHENPYAVHQQVYRPTEQEASSHHRKQSRTNSRKDSTVDKVENRAKGLFKKVEKYF